MNKYLSLIAITSVFFLNGCTAVLVGGAGVGGYTAGTDERPLGVISEDVSITASVKTTLIRDDQIDAFDINVDTYRSVVTLHGHVKNTSQITRAIRLTKTISGVKKVISKLVVIK
ncbi:MAG: BON domain-containing protein [Cycloclasticus sp.]|jgi:hyperosmotically inducible protein